MLISLLFKGNMKRALQTERGADVHYMDRVSTETSSIGASD